MAGLVLEVMRLLVFHTVKMLVNKRTFIGVEASASSYKIRSQIALNTRKGGHERCRSQIKCLGSKRKGFSSDFHWEACHCATGRDAQHSKYQH